MNDQLFLTAENDLRNICKSFLDPLGITYFNYLRVYNDGSCYILSTHSSLVKYIFEQKFPVAAPISAKLISSKFSYFILPIGSYNKLIHFAKINLDLEYFIDLVDRYKNYIELFCFASKSGNSEIINYYLANLDYLDQFKSYFKDQASHLLKQGEKNKILLPEIMLPPYMGLEYQMENKSISEDDINKRGFSIFVRDHEIKITSREYDCLSQLTTGITAKEAAMNLGISYRTYEDYLENLKSKLSCHRKSQLINLFLKSN